MTMDQSYTSYQGPSVTTLQHLQGHVNDTAVFPNLSNADCMRAYANTLLSDRRNLLAVTSNISITSPGINSVLTVTNKPNNANTVMGDPLRWIYVYLPDRNDSQGNPIPKTVNSAISNATAWTISGSPVDYCLSEIVPEGCKLQFSSIIMIVAISCNIVKMACLIFALSTLKEGGFTTIG